MTERIAKLQEQVISLYRDEHKSIREIAELSRINLKTVRRVLKINHIPIKGSKKNMIGNRYGRLEVIKYLKNDNSQKAMWECWCDCGGKAVARTSDLTSGKIKSCGCFHSETCRENVKKSHLKYPRSYGFSGIGNISGWYLSSIKNRAFNKGLECSVTKEYLWDLYIKQNRKCNLTGLDIEFKKKKSPQTASLDRIDSSKGYTENNVQWVHKDINIIKQDYSLSEFLNYCKLVIDYENKKCIEKSKLSQ
jgi:hypothetical protein